MRVRTGNPRPFHDPFGHARENGFEPVMIVVVQMVGLGGGEHDLVDPRTDQRAEQGILPDTETVEDRRQRIFEVEHGVRPGIERRQRIDQHDLAIEPREVLAEKRPYNELAISVVASSHHRPQRPGGRQILVRQIRMARR